MNPIIEAVGKLMDIDPYLIAGRCRFCGGYTDEHGGPRNPNVILARYIVYDLMAQKLGSQNKASKVVGRSSSTVSHGLRVLRDWCTTDERVRETVGDVEGRFLSQDKEDES